MHEFNNRIDIQRQVLKIVNRNKPLSAELCGLSEAAIHRWAVVNNVGEEKEILRLLRKISDNLSFLATKSQEQVTEDYKNLSAGIGLLLEDLKCVIY